MTSRFILPPPVLPTMQAYNAVQMRWLDAGIVTEASAWASLLWTAKQLALCRA